MSLSSGTQLGPYSILRSIGAGGMGEVYEARDTRLDRLIAVKVLPGNLVGDPAAQARFEREADLRRAQRHGDSDPASRVAPTAVRLTATGSGSASPTPTPSPSASPPVAPPPVASDGRSMPSRRRRTRSNGSRSKRWSPMMLRSAPSETYDLVFASNDARSRTLAFQLRAALTNSGWTNASTLEIPEPESRIGIFAPQPSRGVGMLTNWARRAGLEPEVRLVPTLMHPRLVIGKQLQ